MKKVIAACFDQVIQFDSEQEVDKFLDHLKSKNQWYKVVWKNTLDDGRVQIRIRKEYNGHIMEER